MAVKKKARRAAEAALEAKVLAALDDVRRAYESRYVCALIPLSPSWAKIERAGGKGEARRTGKGGKKGRERHAE